MLVVPTVRTPLPIQRFLPLLAEAFRAIGVAISPTQRLNLAVVAAIETGRGASTKNWNLGNIAASSAYSGTVWRPPWFALTEASSPKSVALHDAMLRGLAPSAFRAYESAAAGARDFAVQIVRTFPEVLAAADSTDPERLRLALAEHYSHDYRDPAVTASLRKLQREFGLEASGGSEAAGAVALLALGWLIYRWLRSRN